MNYSKITKYVVVAAAAASVVVADITAFTIWRMLLL